MTTIDLPLEPTADEVLSVFFWRRGADLYGRRARRMEDAEAALRLACERHLPDLLAAVEADEVRRARRVGSAAPLTTLCSASMLLGVLPEFLRAERWFGRDLVDRRLRVRLVEQLLDFLGELPSVRVRSAESRLATVTALWSAQGELIRMGSTVTRSSEAG